MRTKTAITETELVELRVALRKYRDSQAVQEECVLDLAELLDCDTHDAMDLLTKNDRAESILEANGLEIAPDDTPQLRVIDYDEDDYGQIETADWLMMALCAMGFAVVIGGCAWWLVGGGW